MRPSKTLQSVISLQYFDYLKKNKKERIQFVSFFKITVSLHHF